MAKAKNTVKKKRRKKSPNNTKSRRKSSKTIRAGKGPTKRQRKAATKAGRAAFAKYQKALSALKRAGILPSSFDVRKAKPSAALTRKIRKYDPGSRGAHGGSLKLVKVDKETLANAKDAGMRTYKGKVIVPRSKGERVTVKNGAIITTKKIGSRKVRTERTLKSAKTLKEYINKNEKALNAKKGSRYGFRIFGNQSYQSFASLDDLREFMTRYIKRIDESEAYLMDGNFEVVKMDADEAEDWEEDGKQRRAIRVEYMVSLANRGRKRPLSKRARLTGKS